MNEIIEEHDHDVFKMAETIKILRKMRSIDNKLIELLEASLEDAKELAGIAD